MSINRFSLSDSIQSLKQLDHEERKINLRILDILYEIEKRKAYAELKYDGLFSFCVKELGYTESQSYQRIQAMRALKTLPELKNKIESGKMNVTTVAQVQSFIRQEQVQTGIKRSLEQKQELFRTFENKTSREVKVQILELKGERIKKKLVFELDEEAEGLWDQTKDKFAHLTQGDGLNCLKTLMRQVLKEKQSSTKEMQKTKREETSKLTPDQRRASSWSEKPIIITKGISSTSTHPTPAKIRYIPAATRREIFQRDQHQCKNCGSKYALQIEHKKPYAQNGDRTLENLELLCRSCNLNRGIKTFDLQKMRRE